MKRPALSSIGSVSLSKMNSFNSILIIVLLFAEMAFANAPNTTSTSTIDVTTRSKHNKSITSSVNGIPSEEYDQSFDNHWNSGLDSSSNNNHNHKLGGAVFDPAILDVYIGFAVGNLSEVLRLRDLVVSSDQKDLFDTIVFNIQVMVHVVPGLSKSVAVDLGAMQKEPKPGCLAQVFSSPAFKSCLASIDNDQVDESNTTPTIITASTTSIYSISSNSSDNSSSISSNNYSSDIPLSLLLSSSSTSSSTSCSFTLQAAQCFVTAACGQCTPDLGQSYLQLMQLTLAALKDKQVCLQELNNGNNNNPSENDDDDKSQSFQLECHTNFSASTISMLTDEYSACTALYADATKPDDTDTCWLIMYRGMAKYPSHSSAWCSVMGDGIRCFGQALCQLCSTKVNLLFVLLQQNNRKEQCIDDYPDTFPRVLTCDGMQSPPLVPVWGWCFIVLGLIALAVGLLVWLYPKLGVVSGKRSSSTSEALSVRSVQTAGGQGGQKQSPQPQRSQVIKQVSSMRSCTATTKGGQK